MMPNVFLSSHFVFCVVCQIMGKEMKFLKTEYICHYIGFIIKFVHKSTRSFIFKYIRKSLLVFYLNKASVFYS